MTSARRGLVLGGGGVLGGSWAVGALATMEERYGFRAAEADIIVGTSAGSVLAALLGAGVTVGQLRQQYGDQPVTEGPLAGRSFEKDMVLDGPVLRTLPIPGSPRLLGSTLRHPRHLSRTAVVSAMLPQGRRSLDRIGRLIESVTPDGRWSAHPDLWIAAMDYLDGRRVVFGRPGAPVAPLASAVMASCAIPAWFKPVRIGGRTYVDGGAVSATSIDVLAHAALDEVYVIAPMVSFTMDRPRNVTARLERRWRAEVTKTARNEAAKVRAGGAAVRMVGPGREDLVAIGANMMDASRRRHVLETSLRTSDAAWRTAEDVSATG